MMAGQVGMAATGSAATVGESVHDISSAVADGRATPIDVAQRVLERLARLEPSIQAMSQFDAERVLNDAEELTEEAAHGRLRGPLHGVPVGIKDWFDISGYPTPLRGSGRVETEDATLVARLRAAGALIVGKTAVPTGEIPPPTRNPWNLEHTAGGSSSGSGAGVAARIFPVSLGEQTGGSNLRPAAYCGVAALKPSYGLLSRHGMISMMWSRDHPGLMGLSATDLAGILPVLAGADPHDPVTAAAPVVPSTIARRERPPVIGHIRNFFPELTGPVMLDALETTGERLRADGATVVDIDLPEGFSTVWHATTLTAAEWVADRSARWAAEGGEVRMEHLGTGSAAKNTSMRRSMELLPATYYLHVRRIRTHLSRLIAAQMATSGIDALIMAVAPGPAPKGFETTGDPALLVPWSFLGMPAAAINIGATQDGLPLAVQLVAPRHADAALLGVGMWCEGVLGLLPPPPMVTAA